MIKETRMIMGMPITLMTPHESAAANFEQVFSFFTDIDQRYSPFIDTSDVCRINRGELTPDRYSQELREILEHAEHTKRETHGYFDVWHDGTFDPSGVVKGWAIQKAAEMMADQTPDYYVEAGGDIQTGGANDKGEPWRIGIRNPFNRDENIAVVALSDFAVATSGSAVRGSHIYDPVDRANLDDIVSITVVAPRIVDADRFATAAFAMGSRGVHFIERLDGYEAYMVDRARRATMTSNWKTYEASA